MIKQRPRFNRYINDAASCSRYHGIALGHRVLCLRFCQRRMPAPNAREHDAALQPLGTVVRADTAVGFRTSIRRRVRKQNRAAKNRHPPPRCPRLFRQLVRSWLFSSNTSPHWHRRLRSHTRCICLATHSYNNRCPMCRPNPPERQGPRRAPESTSPCAIPRPR